MPLTDSVPTHNNLYWDYMTSKIILLLNKYFSFILTILDKCKNVVINENLIKRVETIIKCVHIL